FAAPLIPLAAFWPIISRFKAVYSAHFWSKPSLLGTVGTYGWLFGIPLRVREVLSWTNLASVLIALTAIALAFYFVRRAVRMDPKEPRWSDGIVVAGLLVLPFAFYLVTKLGGGGQTARYQLPAVLGIVLAAGYGLSKISKPTLWLIVALLSVCICAQE